MPSKHRRTGCQTRMSYFRTVGTLSLDIVCVRLLLYVNLYVHFLCPRMSQLILTVRVPARVSGLVVLSAMFIKARQGGMSQS